MAISNSDAQLLRNSGFLEIEINDFANAVYLDGKPQNIDFHSETFQAVLHSRAEWWAQQRFDGKPDEEIVNQIMDYYRQKDFKKRDVWDFVKASYAKSFGGKKIDFLRAMNARKQIIAELEDYPDAQVFKK